MNEPRLIFAGDRDISVAVLDFILAQGVEPVALFVSDKKRASHAAKLREMCCNLSDDFVLEGPTFRSAEGLKLMRDVRPDFVIGIHFPYIVPPEVLELSGKGFLNLHPAYLPYNRGWHTPSWAILDGTPVGATLHIMDAGLDTGNIIRQRELLISPADTADSLYKRLKQLEVEVFKEAWPQIVSGEITSFCQEGTGSSHTKADLICDSVQAINLDENVRAGDLLKRLRALTTNDVREAAFYTENGVRYRIQVTVTPETN